MKSSCSVVAVATLVVLVPAAAPLAFAQTSSPAATSDTASPKANDAPAPGAAGGETGASVSGDMPNTPPAPVVQATDTKEEQAQRYYFVGLRYRGNLIPQFLENLFVDDGGTIFSNSIGIELDMRTDSHSTIPWIAYANYGTGDMLFHERGKPDDPTNYSDVKSGLGAIYLGLDEMWSTPLDEAHHWDFEYGFGVGLGILFGTLNNDWVYLDPNGSLSGTNGNHYTACPGPGNYIPPTAITYQPGNENPCDPKSHTNASNTKTGGYSEPNWFGGGSVPVLFPHISVPQFSIRYKPVKQFEARFGLGFSLTGFWFGISGDYGLEKTEQEEKTPSKKGSGQLDRHGML